MTQFLIWLFAAFFSCSGGSLGGLAVTNDYDSFLRRNTTRAAGYASTLNSYTYDTANRLATVGDATYSATYTYLANSPLLSQVLYKESGSTRLTSVKQYDFADRLQLITSTPTGTNTAPFAFGYLYNNLDQRTRVNAADGSYWSYEYDGLGQLTNGVRRWVDHKPVEGEQFSYAFDDIGNRKSTRQGGNTAGAFLRSRITRTTR